MTDATTLERANSFQRRHSSFATEIRSVTDGGIPNSWGDRDTQHCLLDVLLAYGYLGSPQDASVRYDCGIHLRGLYYEYRPSGKSAIESLNHGYQHFAIGDDEGPEDRYKTLMVALPAKYRVCARSVCVEDIFAPRNRIAVQDMLDALWGAMEHVRKKHLTAA